MNKILYLLLIPICLFAEIEVSILNISGNIGDIVEIDIITEDLTGNSAFSYEFVVSYDPDILHIQEYLISNTISKDMSISEFIGNDNISVALASTVALEGSGVLGRLKVELLGNGYTTLKFNKFVFNEGNPEVKTNNGEVWVGELKIDQVINNTNPIKFKLNQNHPNPFNSSTNISYTIAEVSNVNLTIYNIFGQKIEELINEKENY